MHATQQASQCKLVLQLAEDKKQKIYDKSLGAIKHWLERFDTIIIGPGLGRDEMVHHVVIEVSPQSHSLSCWQIWVVFACLPTSSLHCCSHLCCVMLLLPDHGRYDRVIIRPVDQKVYSLLAAACSVFGDNSK